MSLKVAEGDVYPRPDINDSIDSDSYIPSFVLPGKWKYDTTSRDFQEKYINTDLDLELSVFDSSTNWSTDRNKWQLILMPLNGDRDDDGAILSTETRFRAVVCALYMMDKAEPIMSYAEKTGVALMQVWTSSETIEQINSNRLGEAQNIIDKATGDTPAMKKLQRMRNRQP